MPISLDHNRRAAAPRCPTPPTPGLHDRPRCTTRSSGAGNTPARADYELEARAAVAARGGAAWAGAGRAGPASRRRSPFGADGRIVDLGRTVYRADRYRFQATLTRRAHTQREEGSDERRRSARRPLSLVLAIAVAACGGTPGPRRSPNEQSEVDAGEAVKTDGFDKLGAGHAAASCRPRARRGPRDGDQGADAAVRGEVPERHGQALVPRLRELDQAGQARRRERQPARRVRGQPGLPGRRRAREGGADPAARQVREGLRLGQVVHAGDAAAVQVVRRRQRRSARARSGASPSPASRPACSRTWRS